VSLAGHVGPGRHNETVIWHVHMRDGQAFTIEAERVSLDNGAAKFHSLSRLADSTAAIICAGSWARIVSDGTELEWTPEAPEPEPEPVPFRGGFA
jgi:hypothetical protein